MPRRNCLTSVRYAFICDIVRPGVGDPGAVDAVTRLVQDPDSGALVNADAEPIKGAPVTALNVIKDVPLFAESVLDGGIRVAGTTERFGPVYEAADWVKANFPKTAPITRKDRITNIRTGDGTVVWREDEIPGRPPTEFTVNGVAPVIFMGKVVEYDVLLERAQVQ